MSSLNLGLQGDSLAYTGLNSMAPSTQMDPVSTEVVNGQIPDSTSSAATTASSLQVKGVFVNLPNNPQLTPPKTALVNESLSTTPPVNIQDIIAAQQAQISSTVTTPSTPTATSANSNNFVSLQSIKLPTPGSGQTATAASTTATTTATTQTSSGTTLSSDDISNAYDTEFLKLLQSQVPPLEASDIAKLTSLHYNPDTTFTGSTNTALLGKLATIQKQASTITAQNLGIPLNSDGTSSVSMTANSTTYNANLNTIYQADLATATAAFLASPGAAQWTADDKEWLSNLQSDPTTVVPPYIATAQAGIVAAATQAVITSQNLTGVGFTPPVQAATVNTIAPAVTNYINTTQAVINEATEIVNQIQDPSLKATYLAVLALISSVLANFQKEVNASSTMTTKQAQEKTQGQLDAALNQIKAQGKSALDAKNQAEKFANMGPIGRLIMLIVTIVLAIISIFISILTLGAGAFLIPTFLSLAIVFGAANTKDAQLDDQKNDINQAVGDEDETTVANIVSTSLNDPTTSAQVQDTLNYLNTLQSSSDSASNTVNGTSSNPATSAAASSTTTQDSSSALPSNLLQIQVAIAKANAQGQTTLPPSDLAALEKLLQELLALLSGGVSLDALTSSTSDTQSTTTA